MCSIPGLPTQGSEVSVLVKSVNLKASCGLVELWVNIDDGRKHIYQHMREDIQFPKRKFNGSEGKSGDFCLVCISDTWHRAQIKSVQSENYNVFLIDQGQPHNTSSESLAWGKNDSFLLPAEIESCILANVLAVETESESADKFISSLHGKKFNGLIQDVLMKDRIILLDIPNISEDMYVNGIAKKITVDEFKCLVRKCQENSSCQIQERDQYFYPLLLANTLEYVQVTEVRDPQNIFCRLLIFSHALKIQSEQLQQHCEESSDFKEARQQTCGDPCAAKDLNGRWRRSVLKQNVTSDGAVEVLHVDEGKVELVPVGDIKPLHEKFLRMPVVTYACCLDGVKDNGSGWTKDQTNYLKSLLLHQTVLATVNHHNTSQNVYHVTFYANNAACLNNCFIENAGFLRSSGTEQVSDTENELIASFLHSLGDELCMDVQNKVNINVKQTLPCTNSLAITGRTDDVPINATYDILIENGSDKTDRIVQNNGCLSTAFLSGEQNACDDSVFTVGSIVNIKVSCIESLQKFWCQRTENTDSLRLLMQNLQNHYSFTHPQSLVESICVARNPDDGVWYRARIIESRHSPVVNVRFIDYGQIEKVPLRDVCPIDPAFLRLTSQAFQCCLFNQKNPSNPTAVSYTDSAVTDFQKFVDIGTSSNDGLKCIVKAVTSDEEGFLLNVVDIETPSDSASRLLALKDEVQIPPQVPTDAYRYSTYDIEVGGQERVCVTSSENVNHFYCNLEKNCNLLVKVKENIQQFVGQPHCTGHLFGLGNICLAKYTDNQWYRSQIVETSQKLKVQIVDYGDTLEVKESDICPFTNEASIAKSVPVLAILLGLFDVPENVPQEVNRWFAEHAIGRTFTISVVAKGEKGKLIVQLFDGPLNVNAQVREKISQMKKQTMAAPDQQLTNGSKQACVSSGDGEIGNVSRLYNRMKQEVHSSNGVCAIDEQKMNVFAPEHKHKNALETGEKPIFDTILEERESMLDSESEETQLSVQSCVEETVKTCLYKRPNVSLNQALELYASCIVGPHYFWCQYANTEELNNISSLAQEAAQTKPDIMFSSTLEPGSPCLALFSSDNMWYRAQVMDRIDNEFHVVFIDYGNEADVDIKNVRPVPQSLLERSPQAFLCSLSGFDESKGSWDDSVYDVFYNLLVDKLLRVTAFHMQGHLEITFPQCTVQIEHENIIVNDAMHTYWKADDKGHILPENPPIGTLLQPSQTVSSMTHPNISTGNGKTCIYKNPIIATNKKEEVYASCIVGPSFFWCQYAKTEDLDELSRLSQEAGQAQLDTMFPETLVPGSPCLALFSSDSQWYRAQVMDKVEDAFHVMFIDYGNESDVNIKNVRPLPLGLLEKAPQAFLCSLNGFDEFSGSWDDDVYEDFYNVLANQLLTLTVLNIENHLEMAVPQHSVGIECDGVVVNEAMQKYWKPFPTQCISKESAKTEMDRIEPESNQRHLSDSKEKMNTSMYKEPNISKNKIEDVYASCIVGPCFFWCQYGKTEDLDKISRLSQEAGPAQLDTMSPETLVPGSPCLALFSSDSQWYRAQVMDRHDNTFHIMFVDYGNESDVDIKNVRPLPPGLLDTAPLAFLCCLKGLEQSRDSWDDKLYDAFYNLLANKPLRLTVFNMEFSKSVMAVPQYTVQVECKDAVTGEWLVVNTLMEKWTRQRPCHNSGINSGSRYIHVNTQL